MEFYRFGQGIHLMNSLSVVSEVFLISAGFVVACFCGGVWWGGVCFFFVVASVYLLNLHRHTQQCRHSLFAVLVLQDLYWIAFFENNHQFFQSFLVGHLF